MFATLVVGAIFGGIFLLALKKTKDSLKSDKCAGCGGHCSSDKKKRCGIEIEDE